MYLLYSLQWETSFFSLVKHLLYYAPRKCFSLNWTENRHFQYQPWILNEEFSRTKLGTSSCSISEECTDSISLSTCCQQHHHNTTLHVSFWKWVIFVVFISQPWCTRKIKKNIIHTRPKVLSSHKTVVSALGWLQAVSSQNR